MPVTSIVCQPEKGSAVKADANGTVMVKGNQLFEKKLLMIIFEQDCNYNYNYINLFIPVRIMTESYLKGQAEIGKAW
jgi:hypothetical protein